MSNITTSLKLIAIFKNVMKDYVVAKYCVVLENLDCQNFEKFISAYAEFISALYEKDENQNLFNYVKKLVYRDKNILSENCINGVNKQIVDTAKYELSLLDAFLTNNFREFKAFVRQNFIENEDVISHLPPFSTDGRVDFDIEDIINSYKTYGYGYFACYSAFRFNENKEIIPIKHFKAMSFKELKNYEYQKEIIFNNTRAFLDGKKANNVLLYGDRGCGKSSTVKALINEFADYNLKIIQISKESFVYLTELYEKIRNLPLKFIIFADDISFEEDDKNFSAIKAGLEGSLEYIPQNAIIYATTNRIHLVKESFSSREGSEVHYRDTIDEMVSLSDRFGIVLTFSLLPKNEYLDMVKQIAQDCCLEINDEFLKKSVQFASLKGIMSPRSARQFVVDYIAEFDK